MAMARRAIRDSGMASYYYRWKSFSEDEDRPDKPRRFGLTEMRGPNYSPLGRSALQVPCPPPPLGTVSWKHSFPLHTSVELISLFPVILADIFESAGEFVDGLKFSGGSYSLMPRSFIKDVIDMAHEHDVYVSTGDWAEHLLQKGPKAFKQYIQECKDMGFDTIELNASSLEIPEESLLRFVHLVKGEGLKVKPQFAVRFDKSEIPTAGNRAFGAHISPASQSSEIVEDVDLLIRKAERCLEAGADMIMIDADDICKYTDSLRTDIIAKIVSRLGLERTMFEASDTGISRWFVDRYGPKVNLFVDHSQVMYLECLRGRSLGSNHISVLSSSFLLM